MSTIEHPSISPAAVDPIATAATQVADFVSVVYQPDDIVEVRRLQNGKGRSTWHRACELPGMARGLIHENSQGWQIYAGANPRCEMNKRGNAAVKIFRVVFVDFDNTTMDEAMAKLSASGLPSPTLIINSGHGIHFYWRLIDAITDAAQWSEFQKDLIAHLDSDPCIQNPERIMRLPGFRNLKEPAADAVVLHCDSSNVHDFTELAARTPARPEAVKSAERDQATLADVAVSAHARQSRASRNGDGSVIDQFNHAHDVLGLLLDRGWTRGRAGRLIRPGGETPSVTIFGDRSIHWSGEDPLNDGKIIASAGVHDAFDIFCLLDNGGDLKKAVRAAAVELGIGRKKESQQPDAQGEPPEKPEWQLPPLVVTTAAKLVDDAEPMHDPVVEGFFRRGEIVNVIAAPKSYKTFLILSLAVSIAAGLRWLNHFRVVKGRVLLIDNELHPPTLRERLKGVSYALGVDLHAIEDDLHIVSLRGQLRNIRQLKSHFASIKAGYYSTIIIDSWYRALPADTDENSNGQMTALYNVLDGYAGMTKAAFVLIHHTSKGVQGNKGVTDVGSGAGAMSRAADTHCVLRPHKDEGCMVMAMALRSFAPQASICFRWNYPLWEPAPDLNPEDLVVQNNRTKAVAKPVKQPPRVWTVDEFVTAVLSTEPTTENVILFKAKTAGISSERAAKVLLDTAIHEKRAYQWKNKGVKDRFATVEPQLFEGVTHTRAPLYTPEVVNDPGAKASHACARALKQGQKKGASGADLQEQSK